MVDIGTEIREDFAATEAVGHLIASGAALAGFARGETTVADARIAIRKTVEALEAWDLVLRRANETIEILKEGLQR
jgi:hypothetical protein